MPASSGAQVESLLELLGESPLRWDWRTLQRCVLVAHEWLRVFGPIKASLKERLAERLPTLQRRYGVAALRQEQADCIGREWTKREVLEAKHDLGLMEWGHSMGSAWPGQVRYMTMGLLLHLIYPRFGSDARGDWLPHLAEDGSWTMEAKKHFSLSGPMNQLLTQLTRDHRVLAKLSVLDLQPKRLEALRAFVGTPMLDADGLRNRMLGQYVDGQVQVWGTALESPFLPAVAHWISTLLKEWELLQHLLQQCDSSEWSDVQLLRLPHELAHAEERRAAQQAAAAQAQRAAEWAAERARRDAAREAEEVARKAARTRDPRCRCEDAVRDWMTAASDADKQRVHQGCTWNVLTWEERLARIEEVLASDAAASGAAPLQLQACHKLVITIELCQAERPSRLGSLKGTHAKYEDEFARVEQAVATELAGDGTVEVVRWQPGMPVVGAASGAAESGAARHRGRRLAGSHASTRAVSPRCPPQIAADTPQPAVPLRIMSERQAWVRLGAFEVSYKLINTQTGAQLPANDDVSAEIFSKLSSGRWPTPAILIKRI